MWYMTCPSHPWCGKGSVDNVITAFPFIWSQDMHRQISKTSCSFSINRILWWNERESMSWAGWDSEVHNPRQEGVTIELQRHRCHSLWWRDPLVNRTTGLSRWDIYAFVFYVQHGKNFDYPKHSNAYSPELYKKRLR